MICSNLTIWWRCKWIYKAVLLLLPEFSSPLGLKFRCHIWRQNFEKKGLGNPTCPLILLFVIHARLCMLPFAGTDVWFDISYHGEKSIVLKSHLNDNTTQKHTMQEDCYIHQLPLDAQHMQIEWPRYQVNSDKPEAMEKKFQPEHRAIRAAAPKMRGYNIEYSQPGQRGSRRSAR